MSGQGGINIFSFTGKMKILHMSWIAFLLLLLFGITLRH